MSDPTLGGRHQARSPDTPDSGIPSPEYEAPTLLPQESDSATSLPGTGPAGAPAGEQVHGSVGRFTLDVTNQVGHRVATVEVVVRRDGVETWFGDRCAGIADRDRLRALLKRGQGVLTIDEVTWSHTPDGKVCIGIDPALKASPLPADIVLDLRARL